MSDIGRTNIGRILPNGAVDPEFQALIPSPVAGIGTLANSDVAALTDDGWLFVLHPSGATRKRVMLSGGMASGVPSVWFAPDETFVVGSFPTTEHSFLLRRYSLDGLLLGNCRFGAMRGELRGIIQPDGKLLFSGLFPRDGDRAWSGIRRLNVDALQSFRLQVLRSNGDSITLRLEGTSDWRFAIQSSPDLTAWQTVPVQLTPGNQTEIPRPNRAEFFRAIVTE